MNIENLLQKKTNQKNYLEPKNGSLKSKTSNYLQPDREKKFSLYSGHVLKSKSSLPDSPNDKFTNFLDKKSQMEFKNNVFDYVRDWDKLHGADLITIDDGNDRLTRIFNLYLNDNWSFGQVAKLKIETNGLSNSTPLRIFILLEANVYKIFLFDPLHLVVPSKIQRVNKTFDKNKGNSLCISKVFKEIDNMF